MKILINWDYDRKDLMEVFTSISKDIDFVYLYHFSPSANSSNIEGLNIIYWHDYASPYEILKEIKPDKVVFHDIESFYQVALNVAAKNTGIPTYVVEHGLRGGFEIDYALSQNNKINKVEPPTESNSDSSSKKRTLLFYLKAFRFQNLFSIISIIKFIYIRRKWGINVGLYKCQFNLRLADCYINFTPTNASYIMRRDNVNSKKFIFIGNPSYDKYFHYIKDLQNPDKENFYLLLDAPFVEDSFFGMSKEIKNEFYQKLSSYCKNKNSKLKIKLHPKSYSHHYFIKDENIEYIKEGNVLDYALKAQGCFMVHLSSLSPIIMYYSKTILFNTYPAFNKPITESQSIPVVDFFTFDPAQIQFNEMKIEEREKISNIYFYNTDGMATDRLKQLLLSV